MPEKEVYVDRAPMEDGAGGLGGARRHAVQIERCFPEQQMIVPVRQLLGASAGVCEGECLPSPLLIC